MPDTKKRVLVAHPRVTARGGGNAVAAWTLQALQDQYDVSLATMQPVDCAALNRSWGTSLREGDFRVHIAPPGYQRLLRWLPTPAALLEQCLTMRLAQDLDRLQRYDVIVGTQNEMDFGRRGIAYVHHPWVYWPRPDHEMRWYHRINGTVSAYRWLCLRVARATNEGLRRNLMIANSSFIADRIRETHGVDSVVLFPPVTTDFPATDWEERASAVVAIGRLHPCKRWEMAVEIVEEVRRRGHDLALTLIGHVDDPEYERHLERLAVTRPWFRIRQDLSRDELRVAVAGHRYGIHTMEDEHFGMAPAEILAAGCILFAHNSGGPVEIVGGDPSVLFDNVGEAADKIEKILAVPGLEAEVRTRMEARRRLFTTDGFCRSLREIVDRFEG